MRSPEHTTYSDLPETVSQHPAHEGLQHVQPEKIAVASEGEIGGTGYYKGDGDIQQQQGWQDSQEHRRRHQICGLARWVFCTIVAVVVVVVVAAVAGGVAGGLTQKNKKVSTQSPAQAETTTSSTSSPSSPSPSSGPITVSASTTTSSASITTTQIPGPTTTLLRDCPSCNNTIYSYGSPTTPMEFRRLCNLSFLNSGQADVINEPTQSLSDCIDKCASYNVQNQTEIAAGTSGICNAVCWRNTFDTDFPGQCFGYATLNSTGEFKVSNESVCDSAAWINQSF